MESLFAQFAILSDQALCDKNFDPYTIENDLMKLFEVEAYKAWAAMELDLEKQVEEAENDMKEAEEHLNTAMEDAMEEFRRFEEEMNQMAKSEYDSLVGVAERARNMGKTMEKVATIAAKKYIEAAVNSAGASMKSAIKAISSHSNKVSSPFGNTLHHNENMTHGQFAFTTTEAGNYLACFWVDDGHNTGGKSLNVGLDWKTGIAAKDWESVARKEKIEGIELELRKLEGAVEAIHENLIYLKSREAEMRSVSEITNTRVASFSLASLGVCVLASVLQILYLKRYFQKKKLI